MLYCTRELSVVGKLTYRCVAAIRSEYYYNNRHHYRRYGYRYNRYLCGKLYGIPRTVNAKNRPNTTYFQPTKHVFIRTRSTNLFHRHRFLPLFKNIHRSYFYIRIYIEITLKKNLIFLKNSKKK